MEIINEKMPHYFDTSSWCIKIVITCFEVNMKVILDTSYLSPLLWVRGESRAQMHKYTNFKIKHE